MLRTVPPVTGTAVLVAWPVKPPPIRPTPKNAQKTSTNVQPTALNFILYSFLTEIKNVVYMQYCSLPLTSTFINQQKSYIGMSETITIKKKTLADLMRVREEFDAIIDSLELMNDSDFMQSYEKAKDQIKNKEFDRWDDL